MIVSTVSGRIRVRSNRLKSERLANNIRRNAEQLVGVSEVRVNPAAGSLVVSYDTRLVDTIDLEDQLEALCLPATAAKNGKSSAISKHVNRGQAQGL